ncbi:MAG: hypothetical protein V1915_05100 [Candidatus Bathyarchaeota archaeon]
MERENPIIASMMFADRAYSILNRVNRVLTSSIIVSSFVITLVALYVTRSFLPLYLIPGSIAIPLGVVVFLVLAPLTVYFGLMAKRTLKAWVQKFATFSYLVRFETTPLKGATPQERLMHQVIESVLDIGNPLKDLVAEKPGVFNDFLGVKLSGEGAEDGFDVCVRKEQIKGRERAAFYLRRALRRHGIILVKRFEKTEPLDENDLRTIHSHLTRTLKGERDLPFRTKVNRVLIVSTSSFSESAKTFVEDRGNWVRGKSFDLVEEGPKGYTVISAIT